MQSNAEELDLRRGSAAESDRIRGPGRCKSANAASTQSIPSERLRSVDGLIPSFSRGTRGYQRCESQDGLETSVRGGAVVVEE